MFSKSENRKGNNKLTTRKKEACPKLKLKELSNTKKMKTVKGGAVKRPTSCAGCVGHG